MQYQMCLKKNSVQLRSVLRLKNDDRNSPGFSELWLDSVPEQGGEFWCLQGRRLRGYSCARDAGMDTMECGKHGVHGDVGAMAQTQQALGSESRIVGL